MGTLVRQRIARWGAWPFLIVLCLVPVARAVDIPITPTKLVVVDKLATASKAKVVFVAKDPAVTKGTGTDVADIAAELDLTYDAESGVFGIGYGASDGTRGWKVNKETVAKFVDKDAPAVQDTKVVVVKPGKILKLVAKGLGEEPFDVLAAGAPTGSVHAQLSVWNGGEEYRHCAMFTGCAYKLIAGGTGAKLVCKNGAPDVCETPPTTTTSTSPPACGLVANMCLGACPSGLACLATSSYCLGGLYHGAPCNPAAPNCGGGLCVPSACACATTTTTSTSTSTTLGCGDLTYPECNGPCPPGMYCTAAGFGAGDPCTCASSEQCAAVPGCYAGFCSTSDPPCPSGYYCFYGLTYQICVTDSCGSDCSCPPTGLTSHPGFCLIF